MISCFRVICLFPASPNGLTTYSSLEFVKLLIFRIRSLHVTSPLHDMIRCTTSTSLCINSFFILFCCLHLSTCHCRSTADLTLLPSDVPRDDPSYKLSSTSTIGTCVVKTQTTHSSVQTFLVNCSDETLIEAIPQISPDTTHL